MIKRKALRKIFITTLTVFILLVVYLIPTTENEHSLPTNLEVEYLTGLGTHTIYLLNDDNLLVRTNVLLYEDEVVDQAREIIDNITLGNNSTNPLGLQSYIYSETKINEITYTDNVISINFNEDFKKSDKINKVIEGIVFSLLELKDVEEVILSVDGLSLREVYPDIVKEEVLTKSFGINKKYDITTYSDVLRIVINYVTDIDDNNYYVPVTRYVNEDREKIVVIIDNLTSSYIYEPNLMSYLDMNTKLIDYSIDNDKLFLNFSEHILTDDDYILEEVTYSLGYTMLDNFDVEVVNLAVNGEVFLTFKENDVTTYK